MNLLRLCLLHTAAWLLAACTQIADDTAYPALNPSPADPYAISVDEAIANMQEVLALIDGDQTRGSVGRRIREVKTLRNPSARSETRGTAASSPGNMLHIVNFEDDAGFAVLSADRRLSDEVIAVTDRGNINMRILDSLCASRPDSQLNMRL